MILVKKFQFFSYLFLAKMRLKTESSAFHNYSKARTKHHRLEGLLRFKKPIISRKLYIAFQSLLYSIKSFKAMRACVLFKRFYYLS